MPETPDQKRIKAIFLEWLEISARIPVLEGELDALRAKEAELKFGVLNEMSAGQKMLTIREREVLVGIQSGKRNKEIANDLHIGERTVKFHVSKILAKFKKESRHDL